MNSRIRADDPAALAEDLADLGVDNQVEIALAIAGFDVGQAVPLLRQRQQRLGQQLQRFGPQGELAGLGPEGYADDADNVADVELTVESEGCFAELFLGDVYLAATAAVLQLQEGRLAEVAAGHDPAGQGVALGTVAQGRGIIPGMRGMQLGGGSGSPRKSLAKGLMPSAAQFLELGPALGQDVATFFHRSYLSIP